MIVKKAAAGEERLRFEKRGKRKKQSDKRRGSMRKSKTCEKSKRGESDKRETLLNKEEKTLLGYERRLRNIYRAEKKKT